MGRPPTLESPPSWCPCVPVPALAGSRPPKHSWGGKRGMKEVMIQRSGEQRQRIPMCSEPGSLQSRVTSQPRVPLGETHHTGTPRGRVTSWLGCPQSLCGSRGTGRALARGVCWGFAGGCGTEGREGRKEGVVFSLPCCRYPSPRFLLCLGIGQCQSGWHKGWRPPQYPVPSSAGDPELCPVPFPAGAGDSSRQQGHHLDTHIFYSCKHHKSAWLLFP